MTADVDATRTLESTGARSVRRRLGRAFTGGVLAAATLLAAACGGNDPPAPTPTLEPTATPTASPEATPVSTPTPEPTPEPRGPRPAAPIPLGASAGLFNAPSAGLPPPPPAYRQSAPNAGGIERIVAPALSIDHYITTLGVSGGQMDSPDSDGSYAVGWYPPTAEYAFGVPGEGGNVVLSSHETWNHMQGPFYRAHKARIGEDIYLDMADGSRRRYQVISLERYTTTTIPMAEVLWPTNRPASEEWMTLITCGGRIVYDRNGYGDYLDRDVLVAKWVG